MKAETLDKDDIELWFEEPPTSKREVKVSTVPKKKSPPFLEQSSWAIMYGVIKELLKRHGIALQIAGFWLVLAYVIWSKLA